jgi:nitrite reductase/ring-hydroxylating ferredoxin subunit
VSGFVRVLPSRDLAAADGLESDIRCVKVGDDVVLVGRLRSGEVVAFGASCPHENTDLGQATFVSGKVRCPRHNYLYDPYTGANVIPTEVSRPENLWKLRPGFLPTYRVEERDRWVWVSKRPNPPPAGWCPATEERPPRLPTAPAAVPVASPPPGVGPLEHPVETMRVRLGAEFEVRLPTATLPACSWRIEVPATILVVVEQSFDPCVSPPHHRLQLMAHGAGEGTLRCSYGQPWEASPIEIRSYAVHVESG